MNDFLQKYGSGSLKHVKSSNDHGVIDKALNDEDWSVREAAAENPNATKEHLDKVELYPYK